MSRAAEAARSVLTTFAQPLLAIPGTNLCAEQRPKAPRGHWNYWWQAHFLDCVVDARQRGCSIVPRQLFARQLRGMWLRQGLRLSNRFYDDMAWLALAAQRGGRVIAALEQQLRASITPRWGGGSFWTVEHEYKATAATGPISLYLARRGDHTLARELTGWLTSQLAHPDTGLLRDGIRLKGGALVVEEPVFTYNQGPVMGTWLALGDDASLAAVATQVAAIAAHLTIDDTCVLRTHGEGDGALFTGILTRYLALAANDDRLPETTRQTAARLVLATADNLWAGRVVRGWRYTPVTCFPQDTSLHHGELPEQMQLASQLQAWMALEAAETLPRQYR